MRKRTKVRIRRMLFLAKLAGGALGFLYALYRFQGVRQLVGLLIAACIMTLVSLWLERCAEEKSAHPDRNPK